MPPARLSTVPWVRKVLLVIPAAILTVCWRKPDKRLLPQAARSSRAAARGGAAAAAMAARRRTSLLSWRSALKTPRCRPMCTRCVDYLKPRHNMGNKRHAIGNAAMPPDVHKVRRRRQWQCRAGSFCGSLNIEQAELL